jgi:hypothetical protein
MGSNNKKLALPVLEVPGIRSKNISLVIAGGTPAMDTSLSSYLRPLVRSQRSSLAP